MATDEGVALYTGVALLCIQRALLTAGGAEAQTVEAPGPAAPLAAGAATECDAR